MNIARRIEAGAKTSSITLGTRGFLGTAAGQPSTGASSPVIVAEVIPVTAAEANGLRAGDRIVSVDATRIQDAAALGALLHYKRTGHRVRITWITSAGVQLQATATLLAGPAD